MGMLLCEKVGIRFQHFRNLLDNRLLERLSMYTVQMHKNSLPTYSSYLILGQMGASIWLGDALAPRNGGHGSRALVSSAREVPPDERR